MKALEITVTTLTIGLGINGDMNLLVAAQADAAELFDATKVDFHSE